MVTTARQPKARLAKPGGKRSAGVREHSAQQTRESILRAAIKVFAQHGYEGGSVEKISRLAKSYDRMIYYYFGSKEGLFVEVLETIYQRMNETVVIDKFTEEPGKTVSRMVRVAATIIVERDGHKAMVIGEGGERLKQIGTLARQELEKLMDAKVFLELWVKVRSGWADDEARVRSFGYE